MAEISAFKYADLIDLKTHKLPPVSNAIERSFGNNAQTKLQSYLLNFGINF